MTDRFTAVRPTGRGTIAGGYREDRQVGVKGSMENAEKPQDIKKDLEMSVGDYAYAGVKVGLSTVRMSPESL